MGGRDGVRARWGEGTGRECGGAAGQDECERGQDVLATWSSPLPSTHTQPSLQY